MPPQSRHSKPVGSFGRPWQRVLRSGCMGECLRVTDEGPSGGPSQLGPHACATDWQGAGVRLVTLPVNCHSFLSCIGATTASHPSTARRPLTHAWIAAVKPARQPRGGAGLVEESREGQLVTFQLCPHAPPPVRISFVKRPDGSVGSGMDPVALNVLTRQTSCGGGQMVHRTSTGDRDILQALRDEAAQLQAAVKSPRAAR